MEDRTIRKLVVVVLPDTFRGMGPHRNSAETQQSGHAPGTEMKNERYIKNCNYKKNFVVVCEGVGVPVWIS